MKKEVLINDNVIVSSLNDLISDRYGDYAKYIIQERALPDARDGLKPVQRRILYAMYKDGNTSEKPFRKSAKTVGLVIGNYHPHGDSSVYEAMVRLSQSWKINHPLVQMHGNNGSIDDDPAAAMRYTEARLAAISETLLEDIDKDTVSWTPNFDDTENEPTVLPAKYPNLLVNGCTGIAAGYATNIPPHNLREVVEGTIYRINHPDCSLDDLMKIIKGPDFPTGGIVQGLSSIKEAFSSGKGKIIVRSKVEITKDKSGLQHLIVSQIPYEVIKCNIVKKIDEIRFDHDIDGILDCRDESDRNGLRIVVDINKDSNAEMILNYLYKNTDLQVSYNYNMVAIVDSTPRLLGLIDALDCYINFSKEVVLKRSKYELDKRLARCHILEGLIKAVSVLDEIIAIIRSSKDKADAKDRLIKRFDFSNEQAEAIVVLRLYRLTNTDVLELRNEYQQLIIESKELKAILDSPIILNKTICDELTNFKNKFAHDRLTQIQQEVSDITIDKQAMITNERVVISLSKDGYVKRVSLRSYNASDAKLPGLKDNDQLVGFSEADTLDTMISFTNSGEYVLLPIYQLAESKWKDNGQHISNYIKVNNSEKFIGSYIIKSFQSYCWIVTVSANGFIKRSALKDFQLVRTSKSSCAMNLVDDDYVVASYVVYSNDDIIVLTAQGYYNRYNIKDIPVTAPKSKGVRSIKLSSGDRVVYSCVINDSSSELVFINDKGNSKRIKNADVIKTTRATKGLLIAKKNKTNPSNLMYCLNGNLNEELKLISNNVILDVKFKDINLLDADSRFSTSSFSKNFYHYPAIQEIKIIDFPIEEESDEFKFEEISLEV